MEEMLTLYLSDLHLDPFWSCFRCSYHRWLRCIVGLITQTCSLPFSEVKFRFSTFLLNHVPFSLWNSVFVGIYFILFYSLYLADVPKVLRVWFLITAPRNNVAVKTTSWWHSHFSFWWPVLLTSCSKSLILVVMSTVWIVKSGGGGWDWAHVLPAMPSPVLRHGALSSSPRSQDGASSHKLFSNQS